MADGPVKSTSPHQLLRLKTLDEALRTLSTAEIDARFAAEAIEKLGA